MKFNYHTHTCFCDGSSNPEEYILSAIEKGFTHLGFSGHSPVPFENSFAIKSNALQTYCETILDLKEKYDSLIQIYLGLEMDYIQGITPNFTEYATLCNLDYTIGSVHLVNQNGNDYLWFIDGSKIEEYDKGLQLLFGGDIRKAVAAFYEQTNNMILSQKFDIIGHLDKIKMNNKGRYFSENEKWYQNLVLETLELIRESGCICEINTRGIYKNRHPDYYPALNLWKQMVEMNIPVTISSDAHAPNELELLIPEACLLLKQIGFKEIWYFEKTWKSAIF